MNPTILQPEPGCLGQVRVPINGMAKADIRHFIPELFQEAQNGLPRLLVAVLAQVRLSFLRVCCRTGLAGILQLLETGAESLVENLACGRQFQIALAINIFPINQRLKAFIPVLVEVFVWLCGAGFVERHQHTAGPLPD